MQRPILAVDIGNTRIKLGHFDCAPSATSLPEPSRILPIAPDKLDAANLQAWLAAVPTSAEIRVASVNRASAERFQAWLKQHRPDAPLRQITHRDLPIEVALEHPERVGIDRLAGAVAANRLRNPTRPAITVHVGTAITVNLITADGIFRGGAIAPGISISAKALDQFTDLLPHMPLEELNEPTPALGTNTLEAIHSGLFWGAVGTMRELIAQLAEPLAAKPEVFISGGAAPAVAKLVDADAEYVEHLVLSGIALAK